MKWTPKNTNKEKHEVPTFYEVWKATTEAESGNDLPDKVKEFMARAYSVVITKEIFVALQELVDKGDATAKQLLEEAEVAFSSDDETKAEYIQRMAQKYSITANALFVRSNGIPDDISELLN